MLRILILEDQKVNREALKGMILSAGGQDQIYVDSAASFDEAYAFVQSKTVYDAFFLDINLDVNNEDDKQGMDIAEIIRKQTRYEFTPMIMVTSIVNLEMEAYRQLHCYQYILKPYMENDVNNVITKLLHMNNSKQEQAIVVKKDGINYKIKCDSIVYIKAVTRGVCLYLKGESMKVPYLTAVKLMEQLPKDDFIQCHRMFIVNKKYVENVDYVNRVIKVEHYDEWVEMGGTYKKIVKDGLT